MTTVSPFLARFDTIQGFRHQQHPQCHHLLTYVFPFCVCKYANDNRCLLYYFEDVWSYNLTIYKISISSRQTGENVISYIYSRKQWVNCFNLIELLCTRYGLERTCGNFSTKAYQIVWIDEDETSVVYTFWFKVME